jgi:hypothetical protein
MTLAAVAVMGAAGASAQTLVRGGGMSAYNGAPNYPLIDGWENIQSDTTLWGQYGFWDPNGDCTNQPPPCWDFYENGRDYLEIYDYVDAGYATTYGPPPQGESAVVLDWGLFTDQDWGGSSALQTYLPDSVAFPNRAEGDLTGGRFYDFSDFTHINIDYLVVAPGFPATNFRIKTQDASEGNGTNPSSQTEDWYMEDQAMYQDASGDWVTGSYPLEGLGNVGPGTGGFSRPGCPGSCWSGIYGNGEFDTDMLVGFQMEWTAGQLGSVDDSASAGTIIWDNFRVSGERYGTLESFEGAADGSWVNGTGSYSILSSDDAAEGLQSIQVDYNVVGSESWGGSVDIQGTPDLTHYDQEIARTHLSLFYKVLTPASLPNANLTVKIMEQSDGNTEEWHYQVWGALNDESGQWRRLLIPFADMYHPNWLTTYDAVIDESKIVEVQIQLFVGPGEASTGSVLFDRFSGYGFQETDFEAPAAPTGLAASSGALANIVSWTDVPDETGETYTIYASLSPITDLEAVGVEYVATVAEGTEIYTHNLFYPAVTSDLTLYYAITCADQVGNVSELAAYNTATTTSAKGVATIHLGTPPSFVADGDMAEWAGIEPFHVELGTDFGHVGSGIEPTSAEDLSADYYVAIDSDYLYYFIDVNDEVYKPAPDEDTSNRWEYDGVEFYIGLYDGRGGIHSGGLLGGAEPDYQINAYGNEVVSGSIGGEWRLANGDGNYFTGTKTGGWVKEVRISLADMQKDGFEKFVPLEGMRLPIDFSLFDDDTPGDPNNSARETVFPYSPGNMDNSWQSPGNWFFTWIGAKYTYVGVENVSSDVPQSFNLYPNYPNPFNPSTVFRYDLPEMGRVTLRVFNVLGQEVRTLVDADQTAGTYEVRFDARDLASGVYLYQLQSGSHIQARKMLLVR